MTQRYFVYQGTRYHQGIKYQMEQQVDAENGNLIGDALYFKGHRAKGILSKRAIGAMHRITYNEDDTKYFTSGEKGPEYVGHYNSFDSNLVRQWVLEDKQSLERIRKDKEAKQVTRESLGDMTLQEFKDFYNSKPPASRRALLLVLWDWLGIF